MLKAAIVYVQGSAGNLLSRTLSLSEQTVAIVPKSLAVEQPTLALTAAERFALYNNWNSDNWTKTEKDIGIWYRTGDQDFVNYELSPLGLIDQFHPEQFETENRQQVLWNNINSWQHLIFIKYQANSLDTIIKLAELKRKDLSHCKQIVNSELDAFDRLTSAYTGITVNWEDMQQLGSYLECIANVSQQLNIAVDPCWATTLWTSWRQATDTLLNNYE
jgi:hypothetical protein